jgi:arsenical-resistance protein 2
MFKIQLLCKYKTGSSRGRGNRAASWFTDFLDDKKDINMESLVLVDGIKGWVAGGQKYTDKMLEYKPEAWAKQNSSA